MLSPVFRRSFSHPKGGDYAVRVGTPSPPLSLPLQSCLWIGRLNRTHRPCRRGGGDMCAPHNTAYSHILEHIFLTKSEHISLSQRATTPPPYHRRSCKILRAARKVQACFFWILYCILWTTHHSSSTPITHTAAGFGFEPATLGCVPIIWLTLFMRFAAFGVAARDPGVPVPIWIHVLEAAPSWMGSELLAIALPQRLLPDWGPSQN